jgi:hypothetical protein
LQPTVPRDLETICLKCLHKEPHRRYPSALELAEDLELYQKGLPIRARPVRWPERLLKWCRRRPAAAALLGVSTLAALVIVVLAGLVYRGRLDQARAEVEAQTRLAERERQEKAAKARQLEETQRSLFTGQLWRAANLWRRDPAEAQRLLEDETVCPPALRDFTWGYYHRLSRRQPDALRGHRKEVTCLAVTPDGRLLASGCLGGRIILWNPQKKAAWRTLDHGSPVWCLALSPNGQTLYSAGPSGAIKVWKVATGKLQDTWTGHDVALWALALAPDGKRLASGGGRRIGDDLGRWRHGQIKLWDTATGRASRRAL